MTRIKLLWMPGMQCVVYTLEYENISLNLCCNQSSLLLTSLTNKTLDGLAINVVIEYSSVYCVCCDGSYMLWYCTSCVW